MARVQKQLVKLASMTQAKVKAHFKTALTLLFNMEKVDQDFETCNSLLIKQLNKMLNT